MRKKVITKSYTFSGYLANCLVLLMLLVIATRSKYMAYVGIVAVAMPVYIAAALIIRRRYLAARARSLPLFAEKNGYTFEGDVAPDFITKGAVDELRGVRSLKAGNVISHDDWTYCDLTYALYGRTRGGEYQRATVYYGVMSVKLPRALPNVFFDSIKARRRQFRFVFARQQKHSLEGDFDKHFVTYFPPDYTIDSMSFISPEVMWALRAANAYDIEIAGDRLFLYGPLYNPNEQIPDMLAKAHDIKKQLLNNILTYRDDRLPYAEGRLAVTPKGATLKRSTFWTIVGAVIGVAYLILIIYSNVTN
jgi:hypothetical protein